MHHQLRGNSKRVHPLTAKPPLVGLAALACIEEYRAYFC